MIEPLEGMREVGRVANPDGVDIVVGVLGDQVTITDSDNVSAPWYLDADQREAFAHLLITASHEADRNALAMREGAGGG